jgi:hypothetical protein
MLQRQPDKRPSAQELLDSITTIRRKQALHHPPQGQKEEEELVGERQQLPPRNKISKKI